MKTKMTAIYECKQCGTEVTVNSTGMTSIDPIYCCGLPLYRTEKVTGNTEKGKIHKARSGKRTITKISRKGEIKTTKGKK